MKHYIKMFILLLAGTLCTRTQSQEKFQVMDVFDLKYVSNVQISPNGKQIAYLVNFKDIMTDESYSNLWIINTDGSNNQQITKGNCNDSGPTWSNNGNLLAYKSDKDGETRIYVREVMSGTEKAISATEESPGTLAWSPDDSHLAFDMFVPVPLETFYELPQKPDSAEWNDPPIYIDILPYRYDGSGYVRSGKRQLFVLPAVGGETRQVTNDSFNHGAPEWNPDGQNLISHGLIREAGTDEPYNTDVYTVAIKDGRLTALTDRIGPDQSPKVSNNGKLIAYRGFDDRKMSYQSWHLYVMDLNGSNPKKLKLPEGFDRSIMDFSWASDDQGLYIIYEDLGKLRLSHLGMDGQLTTLSNNLGGNFLVRPYTDSGGFSVAEDGTYAFEYASSVRPPEVGVGKDGKDRKLTEVNADFFGSRKMGEVEEIWVKSRYDRLDIQGWVVKPPDFDPSKQYPMVLQIHGGPHASYSPFFSVDYQTYAAAGNVVLYINPRGSTGYGEKFAQEIHHAFPSYDYDDIMTAVAYMREQPYIDKDNLFVTGGSGGGILTAWITTKSVWFRAAAVVKPVINWYSFSLYSDRPQRFSYWFAKYPWEDPSHYLDRSPISFVDRVKTPSLLLTGEADYRTPMADTEQYYAALKMLGVETTMIRIPNASHGIDAKGSGTVARLTAILAWFDKYKDKTVPDFAYSERDVLPGMNIEEQLRHVSQLDKLAETKNDYARCSASASLNAYLVMGGDWSVLSKKYSLDEKLTFEAVHQLQDTLVIVAESDGEPGIYGSFKPKWDKKNRLDGWFTPEEVELPDVLAEFGFDYKPFHGPTKEKEHSKRSQVEKFFKENPNGAILMGVHENMETGASTPIGDDAPGNHYIVCYKRGSQYRFFDTWRKPGVYSHGAFTEEEVETMLFETRNMLVGLVLGE